VGHAQTPPSPAPSGDAKKSQASPGADAKDQEALRRMRQDLIDLRGQTDALARQVEALSKAVSDLAVRIVTGAQIDVVTDYFGGEQANMQPKVLGSYPGRLVSAEVTLVRTEREKGMGTFNIGRSVMITPGGSAAITVEGADVLCNWIVYDEGNAIKVRNEGCTYLTLGLRGHFVGVAYYRNAP
jgi:hypothetical protein